MIQTPQAAFLRPPARQEMRHIGTNRLSMSALAIMRSSKYLISKEPSIGSVMKLRVNRWPFDASYSKAMHRNNLI